MQGEADDTHKKVGTILVYEKLLEVVYDKYVGSTENKFADIFDEIRIRRQCAGQAYEKLAEKVFENARLKLNTRCKALVSIVISNMLYASETWNTLSSEVARLDSLQCQKLSPMLGLNWKDKCTRAIFDEIRSKRAEKLLQEWNRSNRSRDLTQYLIYAAPTQSHTCQKVADFKLAANWTNEGRSAGRSQSPDLMITATRRETRGMTAHMREVN
jgi:hypothetical protein